MANEEDSGIAYLMALKRGSTAAAAAPAPETPSRATSTKPDSAAGESSHQGAEKRRSPRYKCEGSAEIREKGCEVRTWATFTDISLHGCYVEAQATYPVGTVLDLRLTVHGVKIETVGEVRVTYPYLGMGVAFVEMDDENRARLKEVLASISRPMVIVGPGIPSTLPAAQLEALPEVSNSKAALEALIEFFENRQLLMRDEFLRIIRQSQVERFR